jgi:CRP-like cAMP-binding protein
MSDLQTSRDRRQAMTNLYVPCTRCPWRKRPLFKPIDAETLDVIAHMKRDHIAIEAGQAIIEPGAESAELYTLFSGWAFRYKELADGRRQILNILLPGDLIGLQAAMFQASHHGVEALSRVELCVFARREVWSLFGKAPELAFDVTWLGAREESHLDENLMSLGRRTAEERVAAFILGLYKRCAALGLAEGQSIDWPLRQQHVADMLGLSLVHTSRSFNALKRKGMFRLAGGRMNVLNPYALQRLSQFFDADVQQRPLI